MAVGWLKVVLLDFWTVILESCLGMAHGAFSQQHGILGFGMAIEKSEFGALLEFLAVTVDFSFTDKQRVAHFFVSAATAGEAMGAVTLAFRRQEVRIAQTRKMVEKLDFALRAGSRPRLDP